VTSYDPAGLVTHGTVSRGPGYACPTRFRPVLPPPARLAGGPVRTGGACPFID